MMTSFAVVLPPIAIRILPRLRSRFIESNPFECQKVESWLLIAIRMSVFTPLHVCGRALLYILIFEIALSVSNVRRG